MIDPDLKAQLIAQFQQHLEAAAETDLGQVETGEIDLFTLFTELAALKNEVRLESRQVKQALDQSGEVIDGLNANNRHLGEELARRRQEDADLRRRLEQPLLLEILELRDRIEAGRRSLEGYRPGLLVRWSGDYQALVDGVGEGMEIMQRRLDNLLAQYQTTALDSVGQLIDPETMQVCGTELREGEPDGTVLAEVRKGFRRAGQVLRLAEVIVSKKAADL